MRQLSEQESLGFVVPKGPLAIRPRGDTWAEFNGGLTAAEHHAHEAAREQEHRIEQRRLAHLGQPPARRYASMPRLGMSRRPASRASAPAHEPASAAASPPPAEPELAAAREAAFRAVRARFPGRHNHELAADAAQDAAEDALRRGGFDSSDALRRYVVRAAIGDAHNANARARHRAHVALDDVEAAAASTTRAEFVVLLDRLPASDRAVLLASERDAGALLGVTRHRARKQREHLVRELVRSDAGRELEITLARVADEHRHALPPRRRHRNPGFHLAHAEPPEPDVAARCRGCSVKTWRIRGAGVVRVDAQHARGCARPPGRFDRIAGGRIELMQAEIARAASARRKDER